MPAIIPHQTGVYVILIATNVFDIFTRQLDIIPSISNDLYNKNISFFFF